MAPNTKRGWERRCCQPPTAPNRRHRKLRRGLELAARAECGGDSTQRLPIGLIPRKRVPEVITKSLPALWA